MIVIKQFSYYHVVIYLREEDRFTVRRLVLRALRQKVRFFPLACLHPEVRLHTADLLILRHLDAATRLRYERLADERGFLEPPRIRRVWAMIYTYERK